MLGVREPRRAGGRDVEDAQVEADRSAGGRVPRDGRAAGVAGEAEVGVPAVLAADDRDPAAGDRLGVAAARRGDVRTDGEDGDVALELDAVVDGDELVAVEVVVDVDAVPLATETSPPR